MNRRELVLKAFNNEPIDKILCGFWHHYLDDEAVDGLHNPGYIVSNLEGARKFKEEFDPDFVKVMTDGFFFFPFKYEKIHSAHDLANLEPCEDMDVYFERVVEFAREVRKIYGDEVLMFFNVFSPTFQLNMRMAQTHPELKNGETNAIIAMLKEDPEATVKALQLIGDYTEVLINKVLGAGIADGIFLSVSCYNRAISTEDYAALIAPIEKKLIALANSYSENNILHICGWRGNTNNLAAYVDYDCKVINWGVHVEGVSLAEGKKMFGGKCVIGGYGNNREDLLASGTKEDIQAYAEQIVKEAGTTGVIIGCDCTTHLFTPDEHIHWVYEKAAELSRELL